VRRSGAYQRIVRTALFPMLLEFSAGQWWFYPVELLGVFAAAITGAVLALRGGLSVVGLVIVAMVTSIGGGVLRDALINRPVPSVLQSPVYLGLVYSAVVLVLLAALLTRRRLESGRLDRWLDVLDAIGIAAFTVTGVLIALRMHAEPLSLWGPQLSVLTACGGILVREVILGRGDPVLRPGVLYIEIVFIGSLLLSLFLTLYSGQSTYRLRDIESAVLITMLAVISLRLAALRWQWRSPLMPGRGAGHRR
jgi:polar amino acid transport system substrate-binding protein